MKTNSLRRLERAEEYGLVSIGHSLPKDAVSYTSLSTYLTQQDVNEKVAKMQNMYYTYHIFL
jgi:hypothetical protein